MAGALYNLFRSLVVPCDKLPHSCVPLESSLIVIAGSGNCFAL